MVSLTIIIVSYNTREMTIQCLRSVVFACQNISSEVMVVDNASTDGTVEEICKHFPEVNLIKNNKNVGYAQANNQAMRIAKGKVCVLLNSDTVVLPKAFQEIFSAFESNPKYGVVGPLLLNDDGSIQPSHGKYVSTATEFLFQSFLYKFIPTPFVLGQTILPSQNKQYLTAHSVDWITGACLAIRQEVVEQVGLLNEALFMYGEDVEWCWRVKRAGYDVIHWPDAKVIHHNRQSSRSDYGTWIMNYTYGHLRFAVDHLSPAQARTIAFLICLGSLFRIMVWELVRLVRKRTVLECNQRIEGYRKAFQLGRIVLSTGRLD